MASDHGISKCIQSIQNLGSDASEQDKMACLADLRSESAQWPARIRQNVKQIEKLVSAGNYDGAIKLLELLRPRLASTLATSYRIAAGVALSVAFFFAIFAPMTLEEPNFLTPLATKAASCSAGELFVAVGSDYVGTPEELDSGASVSGTQYSFECCSPSGSCHAAAALGPALAFAALSFSLVWFVSLFFVFAFTRRKQVLIVLLLSAAPAAYMLSLASS